MGGQFHPMALHTREAAHDRANAPLNGAGDSMPSSISTHSRRQMRGDTNALHRIAETAERHNRASERMRRGITKSDAARTGKAPPKRVHVARASAGRTPLRSVSSLAVPKPGPRYAEARDNLAAYEVPVPRGDAPEQKKRAFHVFETERALLLAPRRTEAVAPDVLCEALERAYDGAWPLAVAGGATVELFSATEPLPFPLFSAVEGSAHAVHALRFNLDPGTTVFALWGTDAHAESVPPEKLGLDARGLAELQDKAAQMLALAVVGDAL